MKDIDKVIKSLESGVTADIFYDAKLDTPYDDPQIGEEINEFQSAVHDAIELLKVMKESHHEWVQ